MNTILKIQGIIIGLLVILYLIGTNLMLAMELEFVHSDYEYMMYHNEQIQLDLLDDNDKESY
tara:strand:+ start:816 stop:1001 length:186 start_codon:yes stop_codon:yes gene_type:complete